MTDNEHRWGLAMPFLPVTSRGGPYADNAYVAGYEAGGIAEQLRTATGPVSALIHAENTGQVDLIAMDRGWRAVFEPREHGWVAVEFTRAVDREMPA